MSKLAEQLIDDKIKDIENQIEQCDIAIHNAKVVMVHQQSLRKDLHETKDELYRYRYGLEEIIQLKKVPDSIFE